jgi:hypothetical protein
MEYIGVILVAALVFGICFLVDKGFAKLFRSKAQHASGLSVRLSKRYAAFGLILLVVGVAAVFTGLTKGWVLSIGGGLLIALGIGLIVYYMSFSIFYDADSFILTTFGKKSTVYAFRDIQSQLLYNNQGYTLVELHMADGRAVHIQQTMSGAYHFLDHAYSAWLRQTGRSPEDCDFHDPSKSCWFPPAV